jgi:hypothetical protein
MGMRRRARGKLLLVAVILMTSAVVLNVYSGTIPGFGTIVSSRGTISVPNGTLSPTNALAASFFNATGFVGNNTIAFDVLGVEQNEPSGGLVYSVTTTGTITVTYLGAQPRVICSSCAAVYNGKREIITYSGAVSDTLIVVWTALGRLTEPGFPATLFKDQFLYQNPYLTNSWTIDRYGASDPTASTSGGNLLFTSSSSVSTQTVHVTLASFNPSTANYQTGTTVKRKLTIGLVPFTLKTSSITGTLHLGLSALMPSGAIPGGHPYGTPAADSGNDSCNTSGTLSDAGNSYVYITNMGYFEGDICSDPSGSKNLYPMYTGDPTLFSVVTIETYGVFCSACSDNVQTGTAWIFFRVYQEDKTGAIIRASDNSINVTGVSGASLAPLVNPTYIFLSQHNSGTSGLVSKIALVDLQNFGSPVLLPPPPSNIPFPTCGTLACPGIQPLIVMLSGFAGNGNSQLGAMIVYFIVMGLTAFAVAVKSRAMIPAITISVLVTLMFVYGGFLPTFLDFIMLFGAGLLIALTVLRFAGIGVGASPQMEGGEE